MLRGIDISAWQSGIDAGAVDADFVIVKVTGGASYVNPDFARQADQALAAGKLLGLYHFAGDQCAGSAAEEAAHFLGAFAPYAGRAVPILDWEAEAVGWPLSWALEWLEAVEAATGAAPWFYSYSSFVNARDCSAISRFPLWIAAYYAGYAPMGYQDDPPLYGGTGAWERATAYQYTSSGRVDGFAGSLDLSVFYGTREDWIAMQGGKMGSIDAMVEHALAIARDDSHGYSQRDRWNTDRDCSSLMYESAAAAGYPVGSGPDRARYTGTMLADFTAAGFAAIPFSDVGLGGLMRGDILLNVAHHTEMCVGGGEFVGAHSSETGGVDGQPGDQTGDEISVVPAYVYRQGWDYVLRPTGRAQKPRKRGKKMECIIQPNGEDRLVYFDGTKAHPLEHPDEATAIQDAYRMCTGEDIPMFKYGSKKAPWATRLFQGAGR